MGEKYSCCVVGAGFLGTRIAGELYRLGVNVLVYDSSNTALQKVNAELNEQRLELIKRGLSNDTSKINLKICSNLREAVRNANFIFEAISDNLALKRKAYKEITTNCPVDAIICSNTLNLEIDQICQDSLFKERVICCRFLAPVYCIPLVEVFMSSYTSKDTVEKLRRFLLRIGYEMKDKINKAPMHLTKEDIFRFWEAHKKKLRSLCKPVQEETSVLIGHEEKRNAGKSTDNRELPAYMNQMLLPEEDSIEAMERLREKQALIDAETTGIENVYTTETECGYDTNDLDAVIATNNEVGRSGHFIHLNPEEGSLESSNNFDEILMSHNNQTEAGHIDMVEADDRIKLCVICHISKLEAVLVPCGHMWLCYKCAKKVQAENKECPACRGEIASVVRVYKP